MKQQIRGMEEKLLKSNIRIKEAPEGENKENLGKEITEKASAKNFPDMQGYTKTQNKEMEKDLPTKWTAKINNK